MQAAGNLLGRATSLLDPTDPRRIAMLPNLALAQWEAGSGDAAQATKREALMRAREADDPELGADVTLMEWFFLESFKGEHARARSDAEEAVAIFERSGNEDGLSRAWQLIGSIEWDLGLAGRQLQALERALEHAERAQSSFETAEVLLSITAALVRGPTPVTEGIERAERMARDYPDDRAVQAYTGHALAHLRARLGDFDGAHEAVSRYRTFFIDTGQNIAYLRSGEVLFDVEMLAGNVNDADAVAEETYTGLLEHGVRWAYLCAFLAQSRIALGLTEQAAEFAGYAVESAIAVERALGLGVLARVRATEGEAETADELIAEAVAIVEKTDFLFDRGTVFLDLAEVERLAGRQDAYRAAISRALAEFDAKGDLVSSARARSLLDG
jgi:tetratricopeptide (TPR) repeat protein